MNSGTTSYVSTLSIYNSELYAGGSFVKAAGINAKHIARLDTTAVISHAGIAEYSTITSSVYPNPFSTSTTIYFDKELHKATLILYDVLGNEIRNIPFSGKEITIKRENLDKGIYFIKIDSDFQTIFTRKVIVVD